MTGRVLGSNAPPWGLPSANALVLLRRCAVGKNGRLYEEPGTAWAESTRFGTVGNSELIRAVERRRATAVKSLTRHTDTCAVFVELVADGPVLVGAGDRGIRDVGMSLHGTYGWPVLPGSGLKGLAHAHALEGDAREGDLEATFGSPGSGASSQDDAEVGARQGGANFLDGLPTATSSMTVMADVMTPHQDKYYEGRDDDDRAQPPAEYWQPTPVPFLSVSECTWLAVLYGDVDAVTHALGVLREAVTDRGVGAKTSAGYGYLRVGKEFTMGVQQ